MPKNQGEVFDKRRPSETGPPTPYLASWGLSNILILPNPRPTNRQTYAEEAITPILRNPDHRNIPGDTHKTPGEGSKV